MNSKRLSLIAELVLVIAGVFVFRGLWMLLDLVPVMHAPLALWVSLLVGISATIWALRCILKHNAK
jgi:F0F1-type ATP synthase assembly protein I